MSYKLEKPYTNIQRADFIVLHNHQNGRTIKETETGLYALEPYEKLVDDEVVNNMEEYEQEQAQKEAERIAMLNLTAADVERAIYKAKGIDFEDVIAQLEAMPLAEGQAPAVDLKALKIELKANNFYRGNPYIDMVGTILGFTKQQLDEFFETNDYRYLTTVTLTINPTPADAVVLINGEAQASVTVPYGETAEYSITKEGYLTQSGSVELTEDKTIDVELVEEPEPEIPEEPETPAEEENEDTTDTEENPELSDLGI